VLIAFFCATAPGFATLYNLKETLRGLSILGILAVGQTFVLIGGGMIYPSGRCCWLRGSSSTISFASLGPTPRLRY
jgi:predicted ABC-type sugar transport system permease subunit